MNPTVSIVGRPNVGKSTLFNRLIGKREAIVHDEYGVTRDRHYGESFWNGRTFTVIDTGGYLPEDMDVIFQGVREQANIAMEESDIVLFVVDAVSGVTPLDQSVAQILRKQDKPVFLVVNKADNERRVMEASEFYELGFDDLYPVSSISGTGTGELLDDIVTAFKDGQDSASDYDSLPRFAFVGRPNAGKSSLVNSLLKSERCIVTDIPGTTRDSVNSLLEYDSSHFLLVDTAGLRKRAKVKENVEFYSNVRTSKALRECDVAIIVIDAMRGFEVQDIRIIKEAENLNKGILIVLNKWDTVPDKENDIVKEFETYIFSRIPDLTYIPVVTTSATTGQRVERIIELASNIQSQRERKISTSDLNTVIGRIIKEKPLPMKRGRALKIQYATQVKSNPPVFKFFMNNPEDMPGNYRKFIGRRLREEYGFTGVPMTMIFRQK